MNNINNCPKCKSNWDGGSILESFIKQREDGIKFWKNMSDKNIEKHVKEHHSPPYRWKRIIGVELPLTDKNYYEGISYWLCPDCNTKFDKFNNII